MKSTIVYSLFYLLVVVSIILSGCLSVILIGLGLLISTLKSSNNNDFIFIFLAGIPIFIFFFQIFQDLNYKIIHQTGYWARRQPAFSHRGFSCPKFIKKRSLTTEQLELIQQSKYRYRLFAILQWVVATIAAEIVLVLCGLISLVIQAHWLIIGLTILSIAATLFGTFYLLEKVQRKMGLAIAYVENEREFYYKK